MSNLSGSRENAPHALGDYLLRKVHPSSTCCQEQSWKEHVLAWACSAPNTLHLLQPSVAACSWQFKLGTEEGFPLGKTQNKLFCPAGLALRLTGHLAAAPANTHCQMCSSHSQRSHDKYSAMAACIYFSLQWECCPLPKPLLR